MGTRLDGYQSFNKPPQVLFFQCSQELHSLDAGDAASAWALCHKGDDNRNLEPEMCCLQDWRSVVVGDPCQRLQLLISCLWLLHLQQQASLAVHLRLESIFECTPVTNSLHWSQSKNLSEHLGKRSNSTCSALQRIIHEKLKCNNFGGVT